MGLLFFMRAMNDWQRWRAVHFHVFSCVTLCQEWRLLVNDKQRGLDSESGLVLNLQFAGERSVRVALEITDLLWKVNQIKRTTHNIKLIPNTLDIPNCIYHRWKHPPKLTQDFINISVTSWTTWSDWHRKQLCDLWTRAKSESVHRRTEWINNIWWMLWTESKTSGREIWNGSLARHLGWHISIEWGIKTVVTTRFWFSDKNAWLCTQSTSSHNGIFRGRLTTCDVMRGGDTSETGEGVGKRVKQPSGLVIIATEWMVEGRCMPLEYRRESSKKSHAATHAGSVTHAMLDGSRNGDPVKWVANVYNAQRIQRTLHNMPSHQFFSLARDWIWKADPVPSSLDDSYQFQWNDCRLN